MSKSKATSKQPKISILIPIYNVEKYLEQCLDSVVNQTLKDIEIICLDDGSTDSSKEIIDRYAKEDKRIVAVHKPNSGYGDSMNKGLEKATGEYIGIVESDDFIELNAFEKLYDLAKKFDADVVRSNYYHFKGGKNTLYSYIKEKDTNKLIEPLKAEWIFYQAPAIWSAIYRKEFLEDNKIKFLPTPGASYQDTGFNFKIWATTKKAVFTSDAFLHYRLDNESSSVNNPGKVFNVCKEYAEIESYLRKNNLYDKFAELMQMAKFGAYYWNINRLSEELREGFIERVKDEYEVAEKEGTLNESLFLDKNQWNLLRYILEHTPKDSVKYTIELSQAAPSPRRNVRSVIKKVALKCFPHYRKQKEATQLVDELEAKIRNLQQRIKELEKQANDKTKN